jgi:hypothetical protein
LDIGSIFRAARPGKEKKNEMKATQILMEEHRVIEGVLEKYLALAGKLASQI